MEYVLFKKPNFYFELLSNKCIEILSDSYIPGGEEQYDIDVINYKIIKDFLKNNKSRKNNKWSPGIYKCSCGEFYTIDDCSLPYKKTKCANCGEMIGGSFHKLVKREGHVRIFENETEKNYFKKTIKKDLDGRYILFKDYEKTVKTKEKVDKGIEKSPLFYYKNNEKKIREIDIITYRLLNYLLSSLIYCSRIVGYIGEDKIKELELYPFSKNQKCKNSDDIFSYNSYFDILWLNWNLLKEVLKNKNIDIGIFINVIFEDLRKYISKCELMDKQKERKEFENKINELVIKTISKYQELKGKYEQAKSKIMNIEPKTDLGIIFENYPPEEYIGDENLSLLKYFMYLPLQTENTFSNAFYNYFDKTKCLFLEKYILKKDELRSLKYLKDINTYENELIKIFSYKISRKEAKNIKLFQAIEEYCQDENEKNRLTTDIYNNFQKSMNACKKNALQYQCQRMSNEKEYKDQMTLNYYLCDDGELDYGMRIAALYYYFIKIQNEFLMDISEADDSKSINNYLFKEIKKKIKINKATKNEIINVDFENENSVLKNIDDIILAHSRRFFYENNKINYYRYKETNYDFQGINEELKKQLLIGKKMFLNDINTVVYKYEEYTKDNSTIIIDFREKYGNTKLNEKMKPKITSHILNSDPHDNDLFLYSLRIFMIYLNNNKSENKCVYDEINIIPEKLFILDSKFKEFFDKNREFYLEHLLELFQYYEQNAFVDILNNVDTEYQRAVNEAQKKAIDKYFTENEKKLINKNDLAIAVRRYITRKIAGDRLDKTTKIQGVEKMLLFECANPEFWDNQVSDDENFITEISNLSDLFKIGITQSVKFYEYLGEKKDIDEYANSNNLSSGRSSINGQSSNLITQMRKVGKKGKKKF